MTGPDRCPPERRFGQSISNSASASPAMTVTSNSNSPNPASRFLHDYPALFQRNVTLKIFPRQRPSLPRLQQGAFYKAHASPPPVAYQSPPPPSPPTAMEATRPAQRHDRTSGIDLCECSWPPLIKTLTFSRTTQGVAGPLFLLPTADGPSFFTNKIMQLRRGKLSFNPQQAGFVSTPLRYYKIFCSLWRVLKKKRTHFAPCPLPLSPYGMELHP